MNFETFKKGVVLGVAVLAIFALSIPPAFAAPVPGGTLDPLTIPKYVTPLVIPPVMNNTGTANDYDIAVRQFQQQILPGGIWDVLGGTAFGFPATTVWSYGPAADPLPDASGVNPAIPAGIAPAPNSQFNYPAYTVETMANQTLDPAAYVNVRWINDLKPNFGAGQGFLTHILPLDQTLHWANPATATLCRDGNPGTDCATNDPNPYLGPVPIVTHVHGAHVDPHSDGYPEAWWLPAGVDTTAYTPKGSLFDDATGQSQVSNTGYADYSYRQDQPATTLWYHDHTLGMTRNNVYAGPAGFWLIRGGPNDLPPSTLPGPAPVGGQGVVDLNTHGTPAAPTARDSIREIPIVIQDRSFNINGSLFYPASRAFFDGYLGPYVPTSDIAPTWNPEAFFNTMVVNGVTWPALQVAPALYRFRLLNGCNSRFLNLSLFEVLKDQGKGKKQKNNAKYGIELPFYQIGAEQGFLPQVVQVQTGFATVLPGDGTIPALTPGADPQQALLMGLAERADVIVDFRGLANGTRIRMLNTAPDAPFGGFPDVPADPSTTGQVMEFVVNTALDGLSATDPAGATPAANPWSLVLPAEAPLTPPIAALRDVSLNEEESGQVCVTVTPAGNINVTAVSPTPLPPGIGPGTIGAFCAATNPPSIPMAPVAALLGIVDKTNPAMPLGIPLKWTDTTGTSTPVDVTLENGSIIPVNVTENPTAGNIEDWNIYNFTVDAHPIHLHLVRFQVMNRAPIPGVIPAPLPFPQQAWEKGFKDTVIAYPGEITTVRSSFDVAGLYVWHCHIVEHEDNEMMRPYVVSP